MAAKPQTPTISIQDVLLGGLKPPVVSLLYGPPMVGKSFTAAYVAQLMVRALQDKGVIIATEPIYENKEFQALIGGVARENISIQYARRVYDIFRILDEARARVFILDSLSAIADRITSAMGAHVEPRVVAARVNPTIRLICHRLRERVNAVEGVGIAISQSSTMAGVKLYRGLTDIRPSVPIRCGHYIDVEVYMDLHPERRDHRVALVTAHRLRPYEEGEMYILKIESDGVKVVGKERAGGGEIR